MALIYGDESSWDSSPADERDRVYARYNDFAQEAGRAGKLVDGSELASTTTATTVRIRGDETLVSDGPYAETREQLGGYFVLECDTIDEAVELAAKIPGAENGAVEVRPVYEDPEEAS